MLDNPSLYQHSGRLGGGVIVVPVVGILVALVLAIAYAYADVYIPIAGYVSFILVLAFAAGVGFSVSFAAVKSNCRSPGFVRIVGFFIGLWALYAAWAAFIFVLVQRDMGDEIELGVLDLFLRPAAIWNIALDIGETGWYSLGAMTPSGIMLWVLWGIEALVVVGGVTLLATHGISGRVFCEQCGRWCTSKQDLMRLAITEDDALLTRIIGGELEAFAALPVLPPTASPYLRVDLERCEQCEEMATVQTMLVTHQPKKDGGFEEQVQTLTEQHLVTPEQLQRLETLAAREPELPPEYCEETEDTSANEKEAPSA